MDQQIEILVAKILAGEASSQEKGEFNDLLSGDPELQREFEELQHASDLLREAGPLVAALDAKPAAIPAERRRELEKALSEKFGRAQSGSASESRSTARGGAFSSRERKWFGFSWLAYGTALLLAAIVLSVSLFSHRPKPQVKERSSKSIAYLILEQGRAELQQGARARLEDAGIAISLTGRDQVSLAANSRATIITAQGALRFEGPRQLEINDFRGLVPAVPSAPNNRQNELRIALFDPKTNLTSAGLLLATRAASALPLYSPLGATASLTPLFLWKTEPGKSYDLTITDELDQKNRPWQAAAVLPPVDFNKVQSWEKRPLAANNLYRVRISVRGEPFSTFTYTFRTTKDAPGERPISDTARLLEAHVLLSGGSGRLGDALADLLTLPEPLASTEIALRLKLLGLGLAGYREDFQEAAARLNRVP